MNRHKRFKKTNSPFIATLLISALCLFPACEADLFNQGPVTIEKKAINSFSYLLIEDIFDIELVQADTFGLIITAGSEIIDNIDLQFNGDSLYINNHSTARWSRKYYHPKLTFIFPMLKKVTLHEPCNIRTQDTLNLDRFTLWAIAEVSEIQLCVNANYLRVVNASTSAGKYEISGQVRDFSTWMRGSGILEAGDLQAQNITLRSQSIGDCHVCAIKSLEVRIENRGFVFYSGAPAITNHTEEKASQLISLE